jgi:hypothetical protein
MFRSLIAAIAANLRRVLGRFPAPGPSVRVRKLERVRKLDDERSGHFFSWFHFDPICEPAPASSGRTWHCFRPNGEAFRAFVELDVLVDATGRILESRLGLDRAFADHPRNGIFARDLVKSYLQWGLSEPARSGARTLIENIANMAGGAVLMHPSAVPPVPGEDTTGGYLVYLGKRTAVEAMLGDSTDLGNSKLTLTNLPGSFPDRHVFANRPEEPGPNAHPNAHRPSWLRLDIAPAITLH